MALRPMLRLLLCWQLCWPSWLMAEPLPIVSGPGYPPFADPQLPGGGQATELVRAAMARAGLSAELSWRPWQNGYQATLAGEFAATYPYITTAEREKLFLYSAPLFDLKFYVFGRAGSKLDGARPETLRGLRYCLPHGWAHLAPIEQMLKAGELTYAHPYDMRSCMKMIALGQADFTITDHEQGRQALRELPASLPQPQLLGQEMGSLSLHLIIPRNRPDAEALLRRFNAGLAAVSR